MYALKALHKNEIVAHKQEKNVMNERNMMLLSAHPFILTLLATFKDRYKLYMLLEFIQVGRPTALNNSRIEEERGPSRRDRSCVFRVDEIAVACVEVAVACVV